MTTPDNQSGKKPSLGSSGKNKATQESLSQSHAAQQIAVPLAIEMPVERTILLESKRLANESASRVKDLAIYVSQDPILVLEIMRVANTMEMSQERAPITTSTGAVVRLGSENISKVLDEISKRKTFTDEKVSESFEYLRALGRNISIVARLLAESTRKDLSDDAQTVGLMTTIGHMLGCSHLGIKYVELSDSLNRHSLTYRLLHDHHFDVKQIQVAYLQKNGFPESLLFALDHEMTSKKEEHATLRSVVESAIELVEAFESKKWDRYNPELPLPPQSALRLLDISDLQYEKVYKRSGAYLQKAQKMKHLEEADLPFEDTQTTIIGQSPVEKDEKLVVVGNEVTEDEIKAILASNDTQENTTADSVISGTIENLDSTNLTYQEKDPDREISIEAKDLLFSSMPAPSSPIYIVSTEQSNHQLPVVVTREARKLVKSIDKMLSEAHTNKELLEQIMGMLISDGPFHRAAILMPKRRQREIQIIKAVGEGLKENSTVPIKDPLSPAATCVTQIKSFNAQTIEDLVSPLGVSAYAISPLNSGSDYQLVLYADCGTEESVPFEARKIFRYVVGVLNQVLPFLPSDLVIPES